MKYPDDAIREVLLNAIVHRDYGFSGSIIINVYDNRMEFISLGGLVHGLSTEEHDGKYAKEDLKIYDIFLEQNNDSNKNSSSLTMCILNRIMNECSDKAYKTGILEHIVEQINRANIIEGKDDIELLHLVNFYIEKYKIMKDDRLGEEICDAVDVYMNKIFITKEEYDYHKNDIELGVLDVKE